MNKPIYKNLRFENKQEFMNWRSAKTKYIVEFEDEGQDFLSFWIDERGEVIDVEPFQRSVWCGSMVVVEKLKGDASYLYFQNGTMMTHKIRAVGIL